ncbi:MAG: hypothetical protein RhofKO_19250 [Rhodothermales bacterium]
MGALMILLGLLLVLAFVSYTPEDDPFARSFSLSDAFSAPSERAQNALGLVGATLSYYAVKQFLGYVILLLPGFLLAWGYVRFRQKPSGHLPVLTILGIVGAFVLSALLGWFHYQLDAGLDLWSGAVGLNVANWMRGVFGSTGSFLLLIFSVIITAMLVVDRDIQKSLQRVEDAILGLRDWLRDFWAERRARWSESRAQRQAAREVYQAERATQPSPSRPTRTAPPKPQPKPQQIAPPPPSLDAIYPTAEPTPQATSRPEPVFPQAPPPQLMEPAEPSLKIQERIEEERTNTLNPNLELAEDVPFTFPAINLLDEADGDEPTVDLDELEENKQILLDKLETYKIQITDINAIVGPTVTLYELTPAPGVKISRIKSLEDDLAMALAARGIRMIAPIPGKSAIGVEIPNRIRELVRVRDLIGTKKFSNTKMALPLPLGKTIEGEAFLVDLTKMPHMLIAGATGSGKSVGVNTIIAGLLYSCHPSNLKFVMIDPKKIELQQYARLMDHYIAMPEEAEQAIITDVTLALGVLRSCEKEMEHRYDLLSKAMVRGIKDYNRDVQKGKLKAADGHRHLPYIVVIIDELADLMMTAGKEIEGPIARLAQMARAVGIHLILATQRPSVDVITGLIKANFPARVAYQVASKIDSRTIMDQNGAEGLVGNGDLLYSLGSTMVRLQGPFVSVEEVDRLTEFVEAQPGQGPYILPPLEEPPDAGGPSSTSQTDRDDLFADAARVIVRSQQGSVSLLQRKLSVGYSRAARIVDQLEDAGIVGPFEGSKARQVLVPTEQELESLLS